MKCFRLSVAMIAVLFCSCSGTTLEAGPALSQEVPDRPEPTPEIYDPVAGPFVAVVDARGALQDVGAITNAIRSWAGPKLAAFSLCLQPADKSIDWKATLNALDNVSHELKSRGAVVVVVQPGRICTSPAYPSMAGKTYVEIMGVMRGAD